MGVFGLWKVAKWLLLPPPKLNLQQTIGPAVDHKSIINLATTEWARNNGHGGRLFCLGVDIR